MKTMVLSVLAAGLASRSLGATHAVLPGESIQAKVDLAAPGDIVAIFGGTYADDLTVNKAIRLVEADGHEVTLTGNVTFSGVAAAPPFEGFTVGSPGKGVTVDGNTVITVKDLNATAGFGIKTTGTPKVTIIGGTYSKIYQDGGELTASKAAVTGDFETTANCLKTVSFRMNVTNDYIWRSQKAWCGYSQGWHFKSTGTNGVVIVVGSEFDGRNYSVNGWPSFAAYTENFGIDVRGTGNTVNVFNNTIRRMTYAADLPSNWGGTFSMYTVARGVYVAGEQASEITNNYVELTYGGFYQGSHSDAAGIRVESASAKILNNIVEGAIEGVRAPFGAQVRSNYFSSVSGVTAAGGHVAVDSLTGDPLFVVNEKPKLQASSPCINAGVNDPVFNDLDGTRNDLGPNGGCLFDPQGWTTNKPVVISFDLSPQQLLKGVNTQVNLTKGLAVGQP